MLYNTLIRCEHVFADNRTERYYLMSTFSFAGVSTLNGVIKFRVANDESRIKVLAKNGHTSII